MRKLRWSQPGSKLYFMAQRMRKSCWVTTDDVWGWCTALSVNSVSAAGCFHRLSSVYTGRLPTHSAVGGARQCSHLTSRHRPQCQRRLSTFSPRSFRQTLPSVLSQQRICSKVSILLLYIFINICSQGNIN